MINKACTHIAFTIAAMALAAPASAATVYLKSTGSGASCTFAAPCADMLAAITAAGADGVVICLDRSDYSGASLTILQSIRISCGDGLWVNAATSITVTPPANARVEIEGLVVEKASIHGILFNGQGEVIVSNTRVSKSALHGLSFFPVGPSTLYVTDSAFENNAFNGIFVQPTGSGNANVHMRNVKLLANGINGLTGAGTNSTIGININIDDSVISGNVNDGIQANTTAAGNALTTIAARNSMISGNHANGIRSTGPKSVVVVNGAMINANFNGLLATNSGQLMTYGNNQLLLNGTTGAFTGSVALQ